MAWIPAAIGAGSSIIGGIMGQENNAATNAANMAQTLETQNWETYMSDTAMQRRVADLNAAGLNPLLAVSQGGASTPGMQPIPMQANNSMGAGVASAGQSAMQAYTAQKQADNLDAQTGLTKAKTPGGSYIETDDGRHFNLGDQELENMVALHDQIQRQTDEITSKYQLNETNLARVAQDIGFQRDWYPIQLKIGALDAAAKTYGLPELQKQADFWNSNMGKIQMYLSQGLNDLGSAAGTFRNFRTGGTVINRSGDTTNNTITHHYTDGEGAPY